MQNNREDKNKKYLIFLLFVSILMGILNYLISSTVGIVGQNSVIEETETVEEEQVKENINRVYNDLDIDRNNNKLSMSTDETYFIYKCFYDTDTLDFVSKIDNSDFYSIIDIYKNGSYTYIVFKTIVSKDDLI